MKKIFLIAGCTSALLAVIIGAFGAHGLEHNLGSKALRTYETGVKYQFYHSFALLIVGIFQYFWPGQKSLTIAGISFLLGILIFSGSLYLYTLTGNRVFGMITPIGGLSFIFGWLVLLVSLWKLNPTPPQP